MFCLKKTALSFLMICVSSLASSQETDDPKTMPIADVHMHVYETMSAEEHLVRMKENNVRWGGAVGDLQPLFMKELKGRYIAPYGQKEWTRVFVREGGNGALIQMGNFDIFFRKLMSFSEREASKDLAKFIRTA